MAIYKSYDAINIYYTCVYLYQLAHHQINMFIVVCYYPFSYIIRLYHTFNKSYSLGNRFCLVWTLLL